MKPVRPSRPEVATPQRREGGGSPAAAIARHALSPVCA